MKYKVYLNNSKCRIYDSNTLGYLLDIPKIIDHGHGTEEDDVATINAINNISSLRISTSNDAKTLTITFTPITDQEVLTNVEAGKTKVRVQVANWRCGEIRHDSLNGILPLRRKVTYNYLKLPYGTYWTNQPNRQTGEVNEAPEKFTRLFSHDPRTYGAFWLDLNVEQLTSGLVVLSLMNSASIPGIDEYRNRIIVQMFCPAVYRSHKDTFYYERQGNYRLSDNIIGF